VSDVFQEVEEEYRREQMAKLWTKYQVPIIGAGVALILAVAGFQGWNYWRARHLEASSRSYELIATKVDAGAGAEKQAADDLAKLAASGSGGYPMAAQFQEAALRAELGDAKAAVKLYDAISAKGTGGAVFGDYAQLRAALVLSETAPLADVEKRLQRIAGTGPCAVGASPWCVQAQEILAYATWRAGKKDAALKIYADILALPVEPETAISLPAESKRYISRTVQRRAKEMSALIEDGMTLADIKAPPAAPANEPLLLPPTPAPAQPGSLLGPDPAQPPTP
jgi:hypothetical protein